MTDAMTDNRSQSDEAIKRNEETLKLNRNQNQEDGKVQFGNINLPVENPVGPALKRSPLTPEAKKLLQQPSTSTRKAMKVSIAEIEIALSKLIQARPDLTENQILRMAGSTPQQFSAAKEKGEAPGYLLWALRGLDAQISRINQIHIFSFDELSTLFDCVLHRQRELRKSNDLERATQLNPLLNQILEMLQNA